MYKRLRFYFRFAVALTSKYSLFILAGAVLSVAAFFFAPHIISQLPPFRFTTKIGIVGRYSLTDLPTTVLEKISVGLTSVDEFGVPGPGLATSWEIADNGKTVIFTLDPTLHWHDGTKVVSSDIKYQFKDAVIEYPDSSHLVFKLKDPFAPLPTLLSKPVLNLKTSRLLSQTRVLGVGSYRLESFKTNGQLLELLTLSPIDKRSRLPVLVYKFYATPQIARTAFKLGLISQIHEILEVGDLAEWPSATITSTASVSKFVAIFFNTEGALFSGASGKSFRTALSYATNKSIFDYRANGPVGPTSWAYYPEVKKYDYDLKRAQELLKKVEKKPETITLHTVPAYLSVAEQIKIDWERLGVKTDISVVTEIPSQFDALLIAQAIPKDPDQYNLWHSTQTSSNLTGLTSPRIDKLLEDGRKSYNQEERKKVYQDFQKYLVEEVPAIFLFYPKSFSISR